MAAFQSNPSRPFWRGYLKAYQRDSMGNVPVDANGVPLDSALVWEAGQQLAGKSASSRTIYTLIGGTQQAFTKSNTNLTDALLNVGSSVFNYKFTDKDSNTLTRDFTKKVAAGALAALDVKRVSDVPGAVAPPGCSIDCFAYDPNGGDPTSIPPANLGYVGGLNSAVYGNGTKFTNLVLQSSATSITRDALIDFIRGIDSIDEDADTNVTEEREWKLGDIFHSSPVLVTPPISPSSDTSYTAFRDAQKNRTTILLTAANDGMLHAFQESDGTELWAFIPPDQLGRLKLVAQSFGSHPYFADSSPVVADVKISGAWKTIAIFGERRGGRSYFALDITDTTNPQYLWSFTDSKMGETWSEAAIGKVKMADGTTKYVAIVGGGYDTDDNNITGKAVLAIDLATGTKLWEYYNNSSSNDRQYMNFSLAANATITDLDRDGYIDRIYIGDVGGQLWKFDLSAAATLSGGLVNNWTGKRLFDAPPTAQTPPAGEYYAENPIYGAPIPAFDEQKNLWVYFGTGDRNHPNKSSSNRFYGIKDNVGMTNGSPLTEANLVNVTSSNANATQGWYFILADTEKVLASADVFNKVVFFSTFTPTSIAACASGGGAAKLYAVQIATGYAAVDFNLGVALASTDASTTRSKTIGTGIPSKPVIVLTESGATISTSVIAATTSQQLPSNPAPPPSAMRKVLYWRDMF
jgi:type IV pilus assembly protein PilY1